MLSHSGRAASTAWCTTDASSTGSLRSSILPRLMRLTSSRSSTSRTIWPTCRSIISDADWTASPVAIASAAGSARRCGSGPAGCAVRGPASPGIRLLRRSASRSAASARWRSTISAFNSWLAFARAVVDNRPGRPSPRTLPGFRATAGLRHQIAGLIVRDHPNRADSSATDMEGHQQSFDQPWMNVLRTACNSDGHWQISRVVLRSSTVPQGPWSRGVVVFQIAAPTARRLRASGNDLPPDSVCPGVALLEQADPRPSDRDKAPARVHEPLQNTSGELVNSFARANRAWFSAWYSGGRFGRRFNSSVHSTESRETEPAGTSFKTPMGPSFRERKRILHSQVRHWDDLQVSASEPRLAVR